MLLLVMMYVEETCFVQTKYCCNLNWFSKETQQVMKAKNKMIICITCSVPNGVMIFKSIKKGVEILLRTKENYFCFIIIIIIVIIFVTCLVDRPAEHEAFL